MAGGLEATLLAIAQQKAAGVLAAKANKIADDVKEMAKVSIQEWYNAYSPTSYRRQFLTHDAPTRVCEINGTYAIAGVRIEPDQVPDTYYHDSVSYVFPRSFIQGIHGTVGTGGVSEPPMVKLQRRFAAYKAALK